MADEQAQATLERAEEVAQQELATAPSSAKGKERATDADADHEEERQPEAGPSKLSAEERLAKMKQLRQRMVSKRSHRVPPTILNDNNL